MKHLGRVIYTAIRKDQGKRKIEKLFELQNELVFNPKNRFLEHQEDSQHRNRLLNAVRLLSKKKQQITRFRFLEGYDYEEIVFITSLKPVTGR